MLTELTFQFANVYEHAELFAHHAPNLEPASYIDREVCEKGTKLWNKWHTNWSIEWCSVSLSPYYCLLLSMWFWINWIKNILLIFSHPSTDIISIFFTVTLEVQGAAWYIIEMLVWQSISVGRTAFQNIGPENVFLTTNLSNAEVMGPLSLQRTKHMLWALVSCSPSFCQMVDMNRNPIHCFWYGYYELQAILC